MKTIRTENMTLRIPTDPSAPGAAVLTYEFSDAIFNREYSRFMRRNKFDALPPEFVFVLRQELQKVERALLKAVGESVVSAIRAGGIMTKTAGYMRGHAIFKPAVGRAGDRIFRIRSGRLSGAVDYDIIGGALKITWNTGLVAGKIPGRYVEPIDGGIPYDKEPPLEVYRQAGIPTPPTNPVAAIESGDPRFQRRPATGFHPFEGAVKKNVRPLEASYAQAVRDIFERGIFVYGGRKLSLPVYVDKLFADSIQDFYNNTDMRSLEPVSKLKSNEASFFSYMKKIFASNSTFIRSLTFSDVRQIFKNFKGGKTRSVSRGNIGIRDNEFADKFVRDSRRSIGKFLEGIEDRIE